MNTPDTKKLEREYEKGFNERFGVGIWDSRATDKETMLRTHRDEGIFSTDVLKYGKNFINHIITSRDTYWKERVRKEVEGALTVVKLRIVYDRRQGTPAEETVQDIYDSIELKLTPITNEDTPTEPLQG